MTAPSPPLRSFEAELEAMRAEIAELRVAITSPQLGGSSLDGGVLQVRSADGLSILGTWGTQPDGTMGTKSLNKVPPPPPGAADVTPTIAGLDLAWSGQLTGNMPADFRAVRFHMSIVPDFIVGESNYVGSLSRAGSVPVAPLPYVAHYVKLVAVNQAGAVSMPSPQASGAPLKVVADSVLDGIIKDTSLAEGAVTKAALAAGAVTQTAIAPGSIGTPQLIAGAVDAKALAAGSVQAGTIAAGTITGREIKALSLTGDLIAANAIKAGHVAAGAVTADKLEADLALTSRLIAGSPTGTRVELSATGMIVVRGSDGETTFSVDSATGDVVSMGQYYTSRYGERIAMNVAGLSEPAIRAYPRRGNRYADLRSYTRTIGSVDVANWEVRLPLQGTEAGLFDFMVYNSAGTAIGSSRLRFRPFNNSSGVVHPGWAADGQDVAIVFYGGRAFITNSANNDRRPLNCGELYAEDDVISAKTLRAATVRTNGGNVLTDFNNGASGGAFYGNAVFTGDVTYNNLIKRSAGAAKDQRRELDRSAWSAVRRTRWDAWHYRADAERVGSGGALRTHVGPFAEEQDRDPLMRTAVVHDENGKAVGIELGTQVGLLGAALSEARQTAVAQARELRALRRRVAELTARLDQLGATA